jgi:hypothetical protein
LQCPCTAARAPSPFLALVMPAAPRCASPLWPGIFCTPLVAQSRTALHRAAHVSSRVAGPSCRFLSQPFRRRSLPRNPCPLPWLLASGLRPARAGPGRLTEPPKSYHLSALPLTRPSTRLPPQAQLLQRLGSASVGTLHPRARYFWV